MTPKEYSPNGKDIKASMEYTPVVYSTSGKAMFYERLFSEGVMVMVKDKKIQYKIYLVYLNLHGSIPVDAKIKIV